MSGIKFMWAYALENAIPIIGAAFFIAFVIYAWISAAPENRDGAAESAVVLVANETPEIEARSAIVVDAADGRVLFEKSADVPLPLASITKLMTALVVSEAASSTETVSVRAEDIRETGDNGLRAGEKWKLGDLLNFSLMSSSNDGASAMAAAAMALRGSSSDITEIMNLKARELGMANTVFYNETGLDLSPGEGGAYGTAKDVSVLMRHLLNSDPGILDATRLTEADFKSLDDISHKALNTNKIASSVPGLIASKTGFTDLSGGNLAIAFDAGLNHPVVIVVLGSGIDSRFNDVLKLANSVRAAETAANSEFAEAN